MRVRTKVNIIYFVIILFLLGIGAIVTIALLDENNYNAKKEKTSSIAKTTSSKEEKTSQTIETTQVEGSPITTSTVGKASTTSKNEMTKKSSMTTKTKTSTTKRETTTSTTTRRKTTIEDISFSDALNEEIWELLDLINQERRKNGLRALEMAIDLREVAFEAVETWHEIDEIEAKKVLRGYSNYRRKSNQLAVSEAAKNLFSHTREQTDIVTNKNIHYVGIGLINKEKGLAGLPTIYYCIIYE